LTLLADPLRAGLLVALLDTDEMRGGDLALALGVSEDSTSYPLRALRPAGLVQRRAEGRMGYYRLRDGELHGVLASAVEQLALLARMHLEQTAEDDR